MVKMPAKIITWDYVVELCRKLASEVKASGYQPDVIVAIARGGFVPARILCDSLNVIDLLSIKVEHWIETGKAEEEAKVTYPFKYDLTGKRVLLVDDICDTGESFIVSVELIKNSSNPLELKTAAMQIIPETAKFTPDYVADRILSWEWELYPWCDNEDKSNLIRRIMKEEKKTTWSPSEIREKFKEYYGIDLPDEEFERILNHMSWRGMMEEKREGEDRFYIPTEK